MLEDVHALRRDGAGDDSDFLEHLEGVHERHNEREKKRRREVHQRDSAKHLPAACAGHARDLVVLHGDVAQPTDEQRHVVADVFPQENERDDKHAVIPGEPVNAQPQPAIHHAVLREEERPEERRRRRGNGEGDEEYEDEDAFVPADFINQKCNHQGQHNVQRNRHRHENARVPQAQLEVAVLPDGDEVVEPHEPQAERVFDERVKQRQHKRREVEQQKAARAEGEHKDGDGVAPQGFAHG